MSAETIAYSLAIGGVLALLYEAALAYERWRCKQPMRLRRTERMRQIYLFRRRKP